MTSTATNATYKIKLTSEQIKEMIDYYNGYLVNNTSNYMIARAKTNNATITFYRTNVVLFQGVGATNEYIRWGKVFNLETEEIETTDTPNYSDLSVIGTDEVGTGDYFGPVVVCATYVSNENIQKLRQMGVKDSKMLTDKQIVPLSLEIAKLIPYSIIYLDPEKLNMLSKKEYNLNFVKAYLHNKSIYSILKKYPEVKYDAILIDEFTPKEKYLDYLKNTTNVITDITTIKRGEQAHVAIAAASILARAAFIREIQKLSNAYDMPILKGAGNEVDKSAISFVKSFGWKELFKVVKIKFANTERIKQYFENNPLPKSKQEGFEKLSNINTNENDK